MIENISKEFRDHRIKDDEFEVVSKLFQDSLTVFSRSGPFRIMRMVLRFSRLIGSTTMTYHLMDPLEPMRAHPSYSHFGKSRALSRKQISPELEQDVLATHAHVLNKGVPTAISDLLPLYYDLRPNRTQQVIKRLREVGIEDEYMIPVYGPHSIDAVISFGFPNRIDEVERWKLELLEGVALICHTKLIRHFKNRQSRVKLSKQERLVLTWISRGKSNAEIATILDLSLASVDTYVRRIFEKFEVNNRVSAAVRGLLAGSITP